MPISSTYSKNITIPPSAIDENGHVNNVAYVQWMQDIAIEHYDALGGIETQGPHATWVVREHRVEYLLPAFAGEAQYRNFKSRPASFLYSMASSFLSLSVVHEKA